MLAHCTFALKERIFKNVKNLKEKVDANNQPYYINKQLPEMLAERNREIRQVITEQKKKEEGISPRDRSKIEVRNRKVYIDEVEVVKYLKPVSCVELFPDKAERDKQDKMILATADPVVEQESLFQAYAYKTGQMHEVRRAYRKIRRLHPSSDHIMAAYVLRTHKGFQDDGEHGAAHRLLKLIQEEEMNNIYVFVVRNFGGTHLGQCRFEIIRECGKQAISRIS